MRNSSKAVITSLSFDDVLHYQKVVVALKETMQLMVAIEQLIFSFPIESGLTQINRNLPPNPQFWGSQRSKSPRIGGF
ncbi:MAG: hypothetical protein LH647_24080, partial [Leptolyngbyaceae cyanobacterium CAN_BIN12]|nr:hypothetical protein [Leptolyngbyaceae cyanobacterium CAN_BIN12]